jgi:hypothetical protein
MVEKTIATLGDWPLTMPVLKEILLPRLIAQRKIDKTIAINLKGFGSACNMKLLKCNKAKVPSSTALRSLDLLVLKDCLHTPPSMA